MPASWNAAVAKQASQIRVLGGTFTKKKISKKEVVARAIDTIELIINFFTKGFMQLV